MNEKQQELFTVINWIIEHSDCTPTEVIQLLDIQKDTIKEALGTGK